LKNDIRHKAVNFWEDFSTTIDLPTYVTRVVLLPDITYFYYCRYGSLSNFSKRDHIAKDEILGTIGAMGQVKQGWQRVKDKPYFHKWLYKVMMTHFYIACTILKQSKSIEPSFTEREIRDVMRSPLTFSDLLYLKGWKCKNLSLYLIGALPAFVSVALVRLLGKSKGLL
jgi:hypothetical protein